MAFANQSEAYERLFQLNQCLEQAAVILEQFRQEGVIHHLYAEKRSRAVEELRRDLSYVLTGMLHRRELEASVGLAPAQLEQQTEARIKSEA